MSAVAIDRKLGSERAKLVLGGRSHTKHGSLPIAQSAMADRYQRGATSNLNLLTYPETARIARLVTDPGFNTRMLQPRLRANDRHAMSVKASTGLFPRAQDNESWRVAHRITAMFNTIAGEIERNTFRIGGATSSSAPLAQAWRIWGK